MTFGPRFALALAHRFRKRGRRGTHRTGDPEAAFAGLLVRVLLLLWLTDSEREESLALSGERFEAPLLNPEAAFAGLLLRVLLLLWLTDSEREEDVERTELAADFFLHKLPLNIFPFLDPEAAFEGLLLRVLLLLWLADLEREEDVERTELAADSFLHNLPLYFFSFLDPGAAFAGLLFRVLLLLWLTDPEREEDIQKLLSRDFCSGFCSCFGSRTQNARETWNAPNWRRILFSNPGAVFVGLLVRILLLPWLTDPERDEDVERIELAADSFLECFPLCFFSFLDPGAAFV
ncbi:unnamed protein product [Dibothriocephalus latus]|uniref:Uncharacterized protein n=1 Tax=Dibothriocephalus latus TaxID=60516 RepID=A0A3P7P6K9_DIBLA|nr:unnamed protein product [Dibothriocephalus latus]